MMPFIDMALFILLLLILFSDTPPAIHYFHDIAYSQDTLRDAMPC